MAGPAAPGDHRQELNVHLYWMPSTAHNRTDIDGAVRGYGHKIKGADQLMNKRVVDQTRSGDWSGQIIENPHDSNIAFYKHVGSIAQIQETQTELLEHFEQFGHEYTSV